MTSCFLKLSLTSLLLATTNGSEMVLVSLSLSPYPRLHISGFSLSLLLSVSVSPSIIWWITHLKYCTKQERWSHFSYPFPFGCVVWGEMNASVFARKSHPNFGLGWDVADQATAVNSTLSVSCHQRKERLLLEVDEIGFILLLLFLMFLLFLLWCCSRLSSVPQSRVSIPSFIL